MPLDLTSNSNSTNTDITMTEQQANETNSILSMMQLCIKKNSWSLTDFSFSFTDDENRDTVDAPNEIGDAIMRHGSNRIVDSNFAAANSNTIEIRKISLPRKNIVKGRPKGSGRTVVGTKKKNRKNAGIIATESASSNKRVTRSANKISPSDIQSKRIRN